MRIECNVLNNDDVAIKLELKQKRQWGKFVGDTSNVHAFMEYMEDNEIDPALTEVWWNSGRSCILDIPFEKFDGMMVRPKKDMYAKPGDFTLFDRDSK